MKFIPNDKHPAQHRRQKEQIPVIRCEDGLRCCPMKYGLRTVCWRVNAGDRFAESIVGECNCSSCKYYRQIYENPWDAFLMRIIHRPEARP